MSQAHRVEDLIALFNGLFRDSENTILVRGQDEPIYLPADHEHPHHRILFAHGYFASALHEIAHWCIAGKRRRTLVDFGYWYKPDGRTVQEQAQFEQVEVKPQALEWCFSRAAGKDFVFSADNLSGEAKDNSAFQEAVCRQVHQYFENGFPKRAQRLIDHLIEFYDTARDYGPQAFQLETVS